MCAGSPGIIQVRVTGRDSSASCNLAALMASIDVSAANARNTMGATGRPLSRPCESPRTLAASCAREIPCAGNRLSTRAARANSNSACAGAPPERRLTSEMPAASISRAASRGSAARESAALHACSRAAHSCGANCASMPITFAVVGSKPGSPCVPTVRRGWRPS